MTTTFSNVIRGVAFGDAWGDPVEFASIDTILAKNGPKGPDLPEHLRITDDTQMSLFLADALDQAYFGEADVDETKRLIADAFLDYYFDPDTNSRAPGTTVMGSLGRLKGDGSNWQFATNRTSDGSGTVMRTSPVAFVSEDRWVGIAAYAAAITHGAPNAIAAAILNVAILRELLRGEIKPGQLIERALELAKDPQANGLLDVGEWLDGFDADLGEGFVFLVKLLEIAYEELPYLQLHPWAKDADPSLILDNGGWRSPHTLVIALMAVDMLPDDPWDALRRSITTDGDSDTIGAVTGALLGAAGTVWPEGVFIRLEPRYQRWILNEADDYEFADEVIEPVQMEEKSSIKDRFRRLFKN